MGGGEEGANGREAERGGTPKVGWGRLSKEGTEEGVIGAAPSASSGEAAALPSKVMGAAVSEAPIIGKGGKGAGPSKVSLRTVQPAPMDGGRLSRAGVGGGGAKGEVAPLLGG